MKRACFSLFCLLIAISSFGQTKKIDTLVTQKVVYDTVITYKIMKRVVYDTTFVETVVKSSESSTSVLAPVKSILEGPGAEEPSVSGLPADEELLRSVLPPDATLADLDPAKRFANSILAADMERHVEILASDAFEGRETGTLGQKKAAHYIAGEFYKYGMPAIGENNGYFQTLPLFSDRWSDIGISANGTEYEYMKDFYSFTKSNAHLSSLTTEEVIFLGYGIDDPAYSDYEGVDVAGKVILIYQGEPMTMDSISHISGSKDLSDWATDWRKKLRTAKSKGVTTVLFIERNVKFWTTRYAFRLTNPTLMIAHQDESEAFSNSLYISPDIAKNIIGKRYEKVLDTRDEINATGKPAYVNLKCALEIRQAEERQDVSGENVLGYIEGSDPTMKDELLVVSAHYDHLGKRGGDIFNGADDNASGTSALMELAQAFAEAKKQDQGPKRSVLLMAVSGEEKGLLGSEHYVFDPRFPLEQTVANVNIDMIGRVDRKHLDNPQYIYVIGADRLSTQLHDIIVEKNEAYTNLFLDYTYNAEDDPNRYYYRSDHYNFAERGIPAVFFFSGTHKDYHRKTDTAEKLDYKRMESIARLAFHTVWDLANRPDRIVVDK